MGLTITITWDGTRFVPTCSYVGPPEESSILDFLDSDHYRKEETLEENIARFCRYRTFCHYETAKKELSKCHE